MPIDIPATIASLSGLLGAVGVLVTAVGAVWIGKQQGDMKKAAFDAEAKQAARAEAQLLAAEVQATALATTARLAAETHDKVAATEAAVLATKAVAEATKAVADKTEVNTNSNFDESRREVAALRAQMDALVNSLAHHPDAAAIFTESVEPAQKENPLPTTPALPEVGSPALPSATTPPPPPEPPPAPLPQPPSGPPDFTR